MTLEPELISRYKQYTLILPLGETISHSALMAYPHGSPWCLEQRRFEKT